MASEKVEEAVERLKVLLSRATPGPWELQDGCSWRRIGTRSHDGNVLCPTNHPRDRHPDLTAGRGEDTQANLELIVAAVNALPDLLAALQLSAPRGGFECAAAEAVADGVTEAITAQDIARALLIPLAERLAARRDVGENLHIGQHFRGLVEADRKYLFWLLQRQVALGAGPNSKSHNARIDRILSVLQQAPLGDEREAVARPIVGWRVTDFRDGRQWYSGETNIQFWIDQGHSIEPLCVSPLPSVPEGMK